MNLLDLFDSRRQLIVYRAFFDPGVHGQPEGTAGVEHGRACVGCSMFADHVGNLAHLNARDITLVFASRAPQPEIAQLKEQMGTHSSLAAAARHSVIPGALWTSPRSGARRAGKILRRATRRGRRMSGGGGTTNTTTPQ